MGKERRNKHDHNCQAPHHSDDCSGFGETVDHFTSKAINKAWRRGGKMDNPNREENYQYLSRECHRDKDRDNVERLNRLRDQLKGEEVKFGQTEYEGHFDEVAEKNGWKFWKRGK